MPSREEILAPRSQAIRDKALEVISYLEVDFFLKGTTEVSMTEATEYIGGTSGRGHPIYVGKLEALCTLGLVQIRKVGKKARYVSLTYPLTEEMINPELLALYRRVYA